MNGALINFRFNSFEYVTIIFLSTNYKGRILECIHDGGSQNKYLVQYTNDKGDFRTGTFYENELEILK